jgi:hypothetical protein
MDCRIETIRQTFHFELVVLLKGHLQRGDEVLIPAPGTVLANSVGPGLDTRRTFAVEFSKTGAALCVTA